MNRSVRRAVATVKQALERGDLQSLLAGCTADVVFEFPFAPSGRPRSIEGQASVRSYLEPIFRKSRMREVRDWVAHPMLDPNMAVLEFRAVIERENTGLLETPYIVFLSLRDGLICRYRDYWSATASTPVT